MRNKQKEFYSVTGTFSQPAIHRSCESPAGHSGDDLDEPGPSCYNRRRNTDVTAGGATSSTMIPAASNIEPLEKEFAGQRLSASMGEVRRHFGGGASSVPARNDSNRKTTKFYKL